MTYCHNDIQTLHNSSIKQFYKYMGFARQAAREGWPNISKLFQVLMESKRVHIINIINSSHCPIEIEVYNIANERCNELQKYAMQHIREKKDIEPISFNICSSCGYICTRIKYCDCQDRLVI